MTTRETKLRRLLAGAGALALALGGVVGAASAANAATGYPVPDQPGTLTLHKHVKDDTSPNGQPKGAPLQGVTFTVQGVGTTVGSNCVALDLSTPAGWASVDAAIDGFNASTGALPAGYCLIASPTEVVTDVNGATPTLENLKGLFVVKETKPGPNLIAQPAAPFLVTVPMPVAGTNGANDSWDYSVDAYPKNVLTTVTPTKTVTGTNKDGEVVPGAIVDWTVTVPVPTAAFPYSELSVTDTPATGHVFQEFTSLALNGATLTEDVDYTVTGSTVSLTRTGLASVNAITTGANAATATLTVKVTTKVAEGATGELDNNAKVSLNGKPVDVPPPSTNWGTLKVLKQEATSEKPLAGAAFSVYSKTGATCSPVSGTAVASGTTNAQGVFEQVLWISNTNSDQTGPFTKDYCLVETAAPAGYILDSTPREVTLTTAGTAVTTYPFPNTKVTVPTLPLTGGNGTVALAVGGFGLLAAAGGVVLATRRRAGSKR